MAVVAIIGILAALLLPVLSGAKGRAKRNLCMNNLRQINLGVLMYTHDYEGVMPSQTNTDHPFVYFYRELLMDYTGQGGPSSPGERLFTCPAECPTPTFVMPSQNSFYDYNCYTFSGWMQGAQAASIQHPAKTALVVEFPAVCGFSWHQPQTSTLTVYDMLWNQHQVYNDAMNEVSFVDGHVSYIKIYNNGKTISIDYNPPAGYDYQWSRN